MIIDIPILDTIKTNRQNVSSPCRNEQLKKSESLFSSLPIRYQFTRILNFN